MSSPPPITIRKAVDSDLDRIMQIVELSMEILHSQNNFQWTSKYPTRFHFQADIDDGNLYVAVDSSGDSADVSEGVVVGMIAHTDTPVLEYAMAGCDVTEKCIVPHRLAVHPLCRGKGVAQKLMLYADDLARERGYKYVRVDTNKANSMMRSVFEKIGYAFLGDMFLPDIDPNITFVCYEKRID